MNKNNCLQEIRSRKLLSVLKTTDNHEITLVIKLGGKVMKQNQFEILLAKIDEVNTKIDGVKTEFNTKIDGIKTDIQEIKAILMKHDDAMVEHGWFNKSSFE